MIFISIAAYRDPQLVPTIAHCLAMAAHPDDVRFGICWQHGPEEPPWPFAGDPRFKVLDVDWRDSRGACWARAEIMKLYDGEDWFLQLDSHHRFARDWDSKLLAHARKTGSAKPVVSTYPAAFRPGDPDSFDENPLQMNVGRFTSDGILGFQPAPIADWRDRSAPIRARGIAAGFLFAAGTFVRDVPYDPELYFAGEEISLTVRAFTHGYDLFHPNEIVVWHEYTRHYREHKHWTDHTKANGLAVAWHERDRTSIARVRQLLEEPFVGDFGCGAVRTLAEYEAYAGVNFRSRCVSDHARRALEPPGPPLAANWAEHPGVSLVSAFPGGPTDRLQPPVEQTRIDLDLEMFGRLLQLDLPMVVYVPPELEPVVWWHRHPGNTHVIRVPPHDPEERGAATSKVARLAHAAARNPFGTSHLFWIDAGLLHTVSEDLLRHRALPERLLQAAPDLLVVVVPDAVVQSEFFGGRTEAIATVARDSVAVSQDAAGVAGLDLDEHVLSVLASRQPDRFACYQAGEDGHVGPFFAALARDCAAERRILVGPRGGTADRRDQDSDKSVTLPTVC